MKLIELFKPKSSLLKKILTEAPGTYHHSVMVANLAEAACEALGPMVCWQGLAVITMILVKQKDLNSLSKIKSILKIHMIVYRLRRAEISLWLMQ